MKLNKKIIGILLFLVALASAAFLWYKQSKKKDSTEESDKKGAQQLEEKEDYPLEPTTLVPDTVKTSTGQVVPLNSKISTPVKAPNRIEIKMVDLENRSIDYAMYFDGFSYSGTFQDFDPLKRIVKGGGVFEISQARALEHNADSLKYLEELDKASTKGDPDQGSTIKGGVVDGGTSKTGATQGGGTAVSKTGASKLPEPAMTMYSNFVAFSIEDPNFIDSKTGIQAVDHLVAYKVVDLNNGLIYQSLPGLANGEIVLTTDPNGEVFTLAQLAPKFYYNPSKLDLTGV